MATLSLNKGTTDAKGTDDFITEKPVAFDPDAPTNEIGGMEGVKYLQGKNFFNPAKLFVRQAPKEMWMAPLTPAQEVARKRQILQNKKFLAGVAKPQTAAMPQAILNAERENARARAAETQAA